MFIVNSRDGSSQQNLKTRINDILPYARTFDMLVGFFFFSGFNETADALRGNADLKLRVLVGMEAELCVGRAVEIFRETGDASRDALRERYLTDLRKIVRSKLCDTEEFEERSRLFCELLESGRMEIRKTAEENHAKMYLFEMRDNVRLLERTWITGSSNFSCAGLGGRAEVDVEMSDFSYETARAYFERLWNDSVPLTATPEHRAEIVGIVRGESAAAEVSPYEAYLLLLKNYVETRERFAHLRHLKEIIEEPRDEFDRARPKYTAFRYQMDAISNAKRIVEDYGGVIIADVVGLGKSVVGSVLGSVLAGGACSRGLVIAPPGLVGNETEKTGWCGYLEDFRLTLARFGKWEARSRGKLETIAADARNARERGEPFEYVIVDEAHYFRNEDTRDYALLSEICRGAKVILMTATPFSNRPMDMLALLKLFMPTRGSGIVPDGDLDAFFRKKQRQFDEINFCKKNLDLLYGAASAAGADPAEEARRKSRTKSLLEKILSVFSLGEYTKKQAEALLRARLARDAKEMREVISHVLVRRNRLDLLGDPVYRKEVGNLIAKAENPRPQYFELTKEQSEFYDRVIGEYFGKKSSFTGAAYRPIEYVNAEEEDAGEGDEDDVSGEHSRVMQQRNMHKFICRLLVKRFESSFAAFAKTLENLSRNYEKVLRNAFSPREGVPGYVAISGDADKMIEDLNDGAEFEFEYVEPEKIATMRAEGKIYTIDDFPPEARERFRRDLESDIELMKKISEEVKALKLLENDPKAAKLVSAVREVLAGKLGRAKSDPEKRKVLVFSEYRDTTEHVSAALAAAFPGRVLKITELNGQTRAAAMKNFDAGAGTQCDDFDVMVATDKMSEGFNLNRAGLVVNYDIPWNPVRVIQRVGRINRIGRRVFGKLFIYNFFPTEQGANVARQKKIAETKMFLIHETIGEDAKIFSESEEPTAAGLFTKLTSSVENFEDESFYTTAKRTWTQVKEENPELAKRLKKLPLRVKTFWKKEGETAPRVLLFTRRGNAMFATESAADGTMQTPLALEDAIKAVECAADTPRTAPSASFWKIYEEMNKSLEVPVLIPGNNRGAAERARVRIQSALVFGECGAETEFANDLLADIDSRRTLPEFTLREIAGAGKKRGEFETFLRRLHARVGSLKFDESAAELECLIAEELQP